MASQWARYKQELDGSEFIEHDWGFICFSHGLPDATYIEAIWVEPIHRETKLGSQLVNELEKIALGLGKKFLIASIDLRGKVIPDNLKAALAAGFIPYKAEANKIWLERAIVDKG